MEQLAQSQPMGEVPAGMDPIQPEQRRGDWKAPQECLEANLGSDVGGTRLVCAMRNQGNAHAGAASGVCCQHNKPSEPAQQDRLPLGEWSPECLQAASATPNPESMELVESMAIATILNMDAAIRCDHVALYWQQLLSEQHTLH